MKFLIVNFNIMQIKIFISDWKSEIVNQPGPQTNLSGDLCYYAKIKAFFGLTKGFFLCKWKCGKKKKMLQDEGSNIKFNY